MSLSQNVSISYLRCMICTLVAVSSFYCMYPSDVVLKTKKQSVSSASPWLKVWLTVLLPLFFIFYIGVAWKILLVHSHLALLCRTTRSSCAAFRWSCLSRVSLLPVAITHAISCVWEKYLAVELRSAFLYSPIALVWCALGFAVLYFADCGWTQGWWKWWNWIKTAMVELLKGNYRV